MQLICVFVLADAKRKFSNDAVHISYTVNKVCRLGADNPLDVAIMFSSHSATKHPGAGSSKLTTSLVNVSLNFQT